ncbi:hypothetical protein CRG98_015125 [Punica granatum]|uniref:Uncharacterized protein n=1 Tax=Punica granatum TaxID=22663 RepID=A0A2I0K7G2_PUNGR|nr:hypothetical protein CRG98_015125 [Punica granatum]
MTSGDSFSHASVAHPWKGGHSQAALHRRAHACPDEIKFECAHSPHRGLRCPPRHWPLPIGLCLPAPLLLHRAQPSSDWASLLSVSDFQMTTVPFNGSSAWKQWVEGKAYELIDEWMDDSFPLFGSYEMHTSWALVHSSMCRR